MLVAFVLYSLGLSYAVIGGWTRWPSTSNAAEEFFRSRIGGF